MGCGSSRSRSSSDSDSSVDAEQNSQSSVASISDMILSAEQQRLKQRAFSLRFPFHSLSDEQCSPFGFEEASGDSSVSWFVANQKEVVEVEQCPSSSDDLENSLIQPNCPMGGPGRLALAVRIKREMLPIGSLHICGTTKGIGNQYSYRNNKLFLINLTERHERIDHFDCTADVNENGKFDLRFDTPHYFLEGIGEGSILTIYAAKSARFVVDDVNCGCSDAILSLSPEKLRFGSDGREVIERLTERDREWAMFSSVSEDVIRQLQTIFHISERRARFAVGSLFNELSHNSLRNIFEMDREDVYNAAVDWLFTRGSDLSDDEDDSEYEKQAEGKNEFEEVHTPNPFLNVLAKAQPIVTQLELSFDRNCSICFLEYEERVMTYCHHFYCRSCILQRIHLSKIKEGCECPMCRRLVKENDLIPVPFGIAPSLAEKRLSIDRNFTQKYGEEFLTSRTARKLSRIEWASRLRTHDAFDWLRECENMAWKCYLRMNIGGEDHIRSTHIEASCLVRHQDFANHESRKSIILIARFNASGKMCGAALVGQVTSSWVQLEYDEAFVGEGRKRKGNIGSSSWCLGNIHDRDSLQILMLTPPGKYSRCYCREASIKLR